MELISEVLWWEKESLILATAIAALTAPIWALLHEITKRLLARKKVKRFLDRCFGAL